METERIPRIEKIRNNQDEFKSNKKIQKNQEIFLEKQKIQKRKI